MVVDTLEVAIRDALKGLDLSVEDILFEHPADLEHGDYATNVALILAKEVGKPPRELAEEIVAAFVKPEEVKSVEIAGPGFINFTLQRTCFRDMIKDVLVQGDKWGANDTMKGKRVIVEHTQPNPFKPFHIGHLMSNTIGESIACLYEFAGAEVRRANYQGDVGLHVAKALWGLRKLGGNPESVEDLGSAYVEGNRAYEDDDSARNEITTFNTMVYENAAEIEEAYETGRRVSLEHFEDIYRLLGTDFDFYFFESNSAGPGRALVKEGLTRSIFEESEGAVVFPGEKYGLHTRVFLNKAGLPTYEAKELGLVELKTEKWPFDLAVTTTAVEQKEYFKVVYKAVELLIPELGDKLVHVSHGMMVLSSGKMSSRKGNVITGESLLDDVLQEATQKVSVRDLPEEEKAGIARSVAVGALKFSVLKQRAGKNITFDQEQALSFEGDSGPYLQYAHTRAASVLRKAAALGVQASTTLAPEEVPTLERYIGRFGDVVARAQEEHEPHYITTYLIELASAWNSWYATEKILDDSPTAPYKLALASAFAHTMRNGLGLLGIKAPEKM